MENIEETIKSSPKDNTGFFQHVFNFDHDTKSEVLNIMQYSVLGLMPILLLNKSIQRFFPDADEDKGSLEILAEVVAQMLYMFLGIVFIDRVLSYIPTYSGEKYQNLNLKNIILGFLVIVLSLQTKMGEKVNILYERMVETVEGKKEKKQAAANANNVKVTQPLSQPIPTHQPSQADYLNTANIMNAPPTQSMSGIGQMSTQQVTDFNSMYQQNPPNGNDGPPVAPPPLEPMAANEALGGFSSF